MIRSLLIYVLTLGFLFFLGLNAHTYCLKKTPTELSYSLENVYFFHAIFSLIVLVKLKLISPIEKVFEQLGYIYLGVLILKIVFFCIVFYNPVLSTQNLSLTEKVSLLIPMAIFLIVEVYFVSRILNKK